MNLELLIAPSGFGKTHFMLEDIEKNRYYPTNFRNSSDQKPFVKNMIVVGASTNDNTHLRAGFSNYNYKMVDVFAPGQDIYSTVPDAKYKYLLGYDDAI